MKLYLPLLTSVILLASCTTSYQSGQTPDDVYFSPARQRAEYVRVEEKDDRQYQNEEEAREDRYLRMKTSYRRYSVLDDCDCYCYSSNNYNRYYDYYRNSNYGYSGYNNNLYWNTMNSYNNPYYYNPYYNKPYYSGYIAGNVNPVYNKPRTGNLSTYNQNEYNPGDAPKGSKTNRNTSSSSSNDNNYRSSGTSAGGFLRNVFGGSSNSSSSSSSGNTPSSSSNNSSSSGKSSSSSGTSSAPVRKF